MTDISGHTARAGAHGSSSGSTPVTGWSARPTRRPGNGNSRLAQMPSPRPGPDVPSTFDSRCVSQRSMPRDGTDDDLGGERVGERRGED